MTMKYFALFLFFLAMNVYSSNEATAYPWPVSSTDTQHPIVATVGEYRAGHFHAGVDIAEPVGTNVYPAVSGIITQTSDSAIEDGHIYIDGSDGIEYRYFHIKRKSTLQVGQHATASQTLLGGIGNTSSPHLHFEEERGGYNPLRTGGLTPFVDNTDPVIESVDFWAQGTDNQLTGSLYGKVDLRVDAYDPRTSATGGNAGGHCGVYSIAIEFLKGGQRVGDRIAYHTYNRIPPSPLNIVYATGSSMSNFLYWATNDPFNEPYNKYWNTKQRSGQNYTVDARIPDEAMYPEGNLMIRVIVEDIRGNSATHDIGQQ